MPEIRSRDNKELISFAISFVFTSDDLIDWAIRQFRKQLPSIIAANLINV